MDKCEVFFIQLDSHLIKLTESSEDQAKTIESQSQIIESQAEDIKSQSKKIDALTQDIDVLLKENKEIKNLVTQINETLGLLVNDGEFSVISNHEKIH